MCVYLRYSLITKQIKKETEEITNKFPSGENKEERMSLICKNLPELSLTLSRKAEK